MQTKIALDDKLIKHAQRLTGIKTKREVIRKALRLLILLSEQADVRSMRGKTNWVGNLDKQRRSRTSANHSFNTSHE